VSRLYLSPSSSERRVTSHGWRRRFLERGARAAGDDVDGRQLRLPRGPPQVDRRRTTVGGRHQRLGGRRSVHEWRPHAALVRPALRHFYTSAAAAAAAIFGRLLQQTSVLFLLMLAPLTVTTHLPVSYKHTTILLSHQISLHHYTLTRTTWADACMYEVFLRSSLSIHDTISAIIVLKTILMVLSSESFAEVHLVYLINIEQRQASPSESS